MQIRHREYPTHDHMVAMHRREESRKYLAGGKNVSSATPASDSDEALI